MSLNHEISSSTNNGLLQVQQLSQVQQSGDNNLVQIPQVIQNMNQGSVEINSSISLSQNVSVISPSSNINSEENIDLAASVSNTQHQGLNPQNAQMDDFGFSIFMTMWMDSNPGQMSLERHNPILQEYKGCIRAYRSSVTKEMEELDKNLISFTDYLKQINGIPVEVIPKVELKIQELENRVNTDLATLQNAGVPVKILEEIRQSLNDEIKKIRKAPQQKMEELTEEAFTHFYINTLNSSPKLHLHLNGFNLEKQLRYLSADISDFQNQNNDLDDECREALLYCSRKLYQSAKINLQF
jgi:hypothetical protein